MNQKISIFLKPIFRFCFACTLLFPLNFADASSWCFQEEEVIQGETDRRERHKDLCIEIKGRVVLDQLTMQIEQWETRLKLEEGQVRKLSIAAKAVAGKQKATWARIMNDYEMWSEVSETMGAELDQLDEKGFSDFSQLPQDLLYYMELTDLGVVTSEPTRNEFWLKTLNSVLSEEQIRVLEEDGRHRIKKSIKALSEYVTDSISQELILNDDTQEKLSKLIEKKLSDPPIRSELLGKGVTTVQLAMSRLASVDNKDLEAELTPSQRNRLRVVLAAYSPNGFLFVEEQDFEDGEGFLGIEERDEEEPDDGDEIVD